MSFAAPLLLLGLLTLPALVWLLRVMPPKPLRRVFGGMFFLEKLSTPKRQPVRTPPLILLLRCLAFAAIVVGLAGPKLGQQAETEAGDLLLVVANGWDAAQHWEETQANAQAALATAGGSVRLLTTADALLSPPLSKRAAEEKLKEISPAPQLSRWQATAEAAEQAFPSADHRTLIVASATQGEDSQKISTLPGQLSAVLSEANVVALSQPQITSDAILVQLVRVQTASTGSYQVRALTEDGRTISVERVSLDVGQDSAEVAFRLPLSLRNEVARLSIDGVRSAGAAALLGSSARRTLAGLVASGSESLRDGGFYIDKALAPAAEILQGSVSFLLSQEPGMLLLDDVGTLRADDRRMLEAFVKAGGVLVRFSGPNLLGATPQRDDPLLPAPLLGGERALGGALTWAEPQRVAVIDQESPLAGLTLSEDIAVRKQILTAPGTGAQTWVSLADGTPLMTAARRDKGLVVLVHVSAVPTWSDLPISGLFAAIMQRLAALAETDLDTEQALGEETLPASLLLDGRGRLVDPPAGAQPLTPGEDLPPPGLYGAGATEVAVQAFRGARLDALTATDLPRGTKIVRFGDSQERDLSAPLLAAALILLMLDAFISMGTFASARQPAAAGLALAVLLFLPFGQAEAQLRPPLRSQAADAALALRFGYIKTGDGALDRLSEAGLYGLTREASRRSALEPAPPQAVDIDRDELSVYTLLYWPIRAGQQPPSDAALQRLEDFMDGGGMLIIDTADGGLPSRSASLQEVLGRLDAPPLEPLQDDHVLLFSFYRLDDLPGRNSGGKIWVETRGALDQRRDGVPSLIIAGRDWAGAWALDSKGVPLRPPGPGGEVRREYAFRAGINMAMVAITGNYKADQADVQTLLDQLGTAEE